MDTVEFLDHRDRMIEYGLGLRRDIAAAIRTHRPELLITINHHDTWPGAGLNMADHRVVGQALIGASRDAGNRWVFTDLLECSLEPWNGCRWVPVSGSPQPTHAVDVTDGLDQGVASLLEHRAYLEGLPAGTPGSDPDGFLRDMADQAGRSFGGRPAAAFELLAL